MSDPVVAASFEHVQESGHIARDIDMRVLGGVSHAGLRGEVHDGVEAVPGENLLDCGAIGKIRAHELETGQFLQSGKARLFQADVVVVVEVVQADDRIAAFKQSPGAVVADETGGAGDQNLQALSPMPFIPSRLARRFPLAPTSARSSEISCSSRAYSSCLRRRKAAVTEALARMPLGVST